MFLVCVEALEGCDESKRGTVEKSSEAVEEFSARDRKQILATQVSEALMSLLLGHRPSFAIRTGEGTSTRHFYITQCL